MIRRLLATAAVGMLAGGLLLVGQAQAEDATVFTNTVVDAPDNDPPDGICNTWARDTFTRTTEVKEIEGEQFEVFQHIQGTFTSTGTPAITGTIAGFVEYTVKGELLDDTSAVDGTSVDLSGIDCKDEADPINSTGQWALRFFEQGATADPITNWEYTYATACQVFVENKDTAAVGADTFRACDPAAVEEIAVTIDEGDCGELTFTTAWATDRPHTDNAALVVRAPGAYETAPIGETITVGPFDAASTTVEYRVWGGGERDYDSPALTDLGALVAYLETHPGGELDEKVPGVAWHALDVTGCPDEPGKGGGDDKPDLPATSGSPYPLLLGAGALLLVAGTVALVVGRRRALR